MPQRHAVQVPSYSDTTTGTWRPPTESAVGDIEVRSERFLLSATGFPPDRPRDLELPVVDVEGNLHRGALLHARQELRERPDLTVHTASRAIDVVSELLAAEFGSHGRTDRARRRGDTADAPGSSTRDRRRTSR